MGLTRRLATGMIIKGAGIEDLGDLNKLQLDNTLSLSATPFGATAPDEALYVKRAVPWKGVTGTLDEVFGTLNQYVGKKGVGIGNALRKAIDISRGCAGTKGVARHPKFGYTIPAKALCQINKQKEAGVTPSSMRRYVRVTQL